MSTSIFLAKLIGPMCLVIWLALPAGLAVGRTLLANPSTLLTTAALPLEL